MRSEILHTSAVRRWDQACWLPVPRFPAGIVLGLLFQLGLWIGGVWIGLGMAAIKADDLDQRFAQDVAPFLARYCHECHRGSAGEANFDTTQFVSQEAIANHWSSWEEVVRRASVQEMPPADASAVPSEKELSALSRWTEEFAAHEARRHRGDPGALAIRRLSNAEWNNTIRDLVGFDIRPARDFPIDPANEAGFDNSADSLTVSPALVNKYLAAARAIADHLLLTPEGIRFAPFPVVADTDRDRYCVQRIVDFYQRQPTDLAAYFHAARRWMKERQGGSTIDSPEVSDAIAAWGAEQGLSGRYLQMLVATLADETIVAGPLKEVQERWKQLLEEDLSAAQVERRCDSLRKYIDEQRELLRPRFENLVAPGGISPGSQPLVLWKNQQLANHRRVCRSDACMEHERRDYELFCSLFPDAFYVAERGRSHLKPAEAAKEGKGRLLSAGFHSMMGYFRDDQPLYELILDDSQRRELDQLWSELDFITLAPVRQYSGHLWFERAEASFLNDERFNFVRAEDKNAASSPMIRRFAEVYLGKMRELDAEPTTITAVETYFAEMDARLRMLERQVEEAQSKQLESLLALLETLFRQTASKELTDKWRTFYWESRRLPAADHRTAIEDTLVAMLLSPLHLYRWDLQTSSPTPVALAPPELASRWSYFLWASAPDQRLRTAAADGVLVGDEPLEKEYQRMVEDPRFEGMVREFLGNWLDFRRFELHQGVDRDQFSDFDDSLRQAMFEEPIQYFTELVRRNGPVLELLASEHVVVNRRLAEHYQLVDRFQDGAASWQRIEGVADRDRGGIVTMGVFLTQNSPGLRTSPVKRGYWIVRKVLGEKIPPPPPNVPELPQSEHELGDLTLREILERHREHPSCASCHERFDAYGLLLEGFDPIGRPRANDLAGHLVSTSATLPDGSAAAGTSGLRDYLVFKRADDFRRNFCEHLVAYALGRNLILADRLLVDEMIESLQANDDRIQAAFLVILKSPQFQMKRASTLVSTEFQDETH